MYVIFFGGAKIFKKKGMEWHADTLIDTAFFLAFLVYPMIASKTFSAFGCQALEDGSSVLKVDFSIFCSDTTGAGTPIYAVISLFAFIMLGVHVIGLPLVYIYLFFIKYRGALVKLRQQELDDAAQAKLAESFRVTAVEVTESADRIEPGDVLPGFLIKLTEGKGYEWRTYWFELFEMSRKVMLVGVPAVFSDRGGTLQLFWGLLVCFGTFGAYMMYAPFVEDTDDQLQQLAQAQIFLTLVSSLALRAVPPSAEMEYILSIVMMCVPILGIYMNTPIAEELGKCWAALKEKVYEKYFVPWLENRKAKRANANKISATIEMDAPTTLPPRPNASTTAEELKA